LTVILMEAATLVGALAYILGYRSWVGYLFDLWLK
jgi:hypothetical protein